MPRMRPPERSGFRYGIDIHFDSHLPASRSEVEQARSYLGSAADVARLRPRLTGPGRLRSLLRRVATAGSKPG